MKNLFIIIIFSAITSGQCHGQLSLAMAIDHAKTQSPAYKLITTRKDIQRYQYQSFMSSYKPQVTFYGSIPVYNKEYYAVRQPDGSINFLSINQNMSNVGFALQQKIPLTGGSVSLNTQLTRFDDFAGGTKQYNAIPVFIQLNQPVFAVNELKWNKKIQPLAYEESQKQYAFELEQISETTVDLYFDIIDAQNNIAAAIVGLQNSSVNYEIEKQRIPLGTTTEDRMLQLNLQMLNSKKNLERAKYDLQMAELKFKTFIGLKDSALIKVVLTKNISDFELDLETALQYAKSNRSEFVAFQRQKLESALAVAKAKSARNSVQLFATLGLNNASPNFANVYNDPKMQQSVSVGFTVPIMDWGRSKAALQTALAAEQLVNFNNQLEEINLEMEVKALIENFDLLKINIKISDQADSIAAKRYDIANELYKQGKLSITELGIAQTEKDNSTRSYIGALRAYWKSYYAIRKVTLYDFETKQSLLD